MVRKLVMLIILALILTGCTQSGNKGVSGQWGRAYQGVQASLYSPKSEITKGEPLELFVRFRNVQEKRYFLNPNLYMTVSMKHNGKFIADNIGEIKLAPEKVEFSSDEIRQFRLQQLDTTQGTGVYEFSGNIGEFSLPVLKITVK